MRSGRGLGAAELTRRAAFVVALDDASDMKNTPQNLFAGGDVDFALCIYKHPTFRYLYYQYKASCRRLETQESLLT